MDEPVKTHIFSIITPKGKKSYTYNALMADELKINHVSFAKFMVLKKLHNRMFTHEKAESLIDDYCRNAISWITLNNQLNLNHNESNHKHQGNVSNRINIGEQNQQRFQIKDKQQK
jgi:hypothetical protein